MKHVLSIAGFLVLAAGLQAQEEGKRRDKERDHKEGGDHLQVLHNRHLGVASEERVAPRYECDRASDLHRRLAEAHRAEAKKGNTEQAWRELKQINRKLEGSREGGEKRQKEGGERREGKDGDRRG